MEWITVEPEFPSHVSPNRTLYAYILFVKRKTILVYNRAVPTTQITISRDIFNKNNYLNKYFSVFTTARFGRSAIMLRV